MMNEDDKKIFDELYEKLFPNFVGYVNSHIQDEKVAEDIVQESFIIAYNKIDTMLASPNPSGWLFWVVKNTMRNYIRVSGRVAREIVIVPPDWWANNLSDEKSAEENIDFLYNDLLKYDEYKLLKKFAVDKTPQKELAEEQGISLAACKQKIYRAKIKLGKIIKKMKKS